MKTCETQDKRLALHVEEDLPRAEAAALEEHLETCARCRAVLQELQASQRAVKALAAASLPERSLAAVREKVLAQAGRERVPAGAVPARVWAPVAAAIAALALVLGVVGSERLAGPQHPVAEPAPPASTLEAERLGSAPPLAATSPTRAAPPGDRVASGTPGSGSGGQPGSSPRSTVPRSRSVYRSEEPAMAEPDSALTPQEADQLARAVVALARIEGTSGGSDGLDALGEAHDAFPHRATGRTGSIVRWTTADPDVVIYWQLDSNGGES